MDVAGDFFYIVHHMMGISEHVRVDRLNDISAHRATFFAIGNAVGGIDVTAFDEFGLFELAWDGKAPGNVAGVIGVARNLGAGGAVGRHGLGVLVAGSGRLRNHCLP